MDKEQVEMWILRALLLVLVVQWGKVFLSVVA